MGGDEAPENSFGKADDLGSDQIENSFAVDKFSKKAAKSQILLQLQRSYKDDDRFKLNREFSDIDTTKLPQSMINALTSKEYDDLVRNKGKRAKTDQPNTQGPEFEKEVDALDDEANHHWETDIDLVREK